MVDRRRVVQGLAGGGLLAAGGALGGIAGVLSQRRAPGVILSGRPRVDQGAQIGDVTGDTATLWARADRPARLRARYSYSPKMEGAITVAGPDALAPTDWTARLGLRGLRQGRRVFYEAWFESLSDLKTRSPLISGAFQVPGGERPSRLVWGGDVAGQGYGISPEVGGYRIFDAMAARDPDVFVHCGDMIYADVPIAPAVSSPTGVWRNVTTPAVARAAQTLDEFRGRYLYNLMDDHLRAFNRQVAQVVLWDDHEITNDWHPRDRTWRPEDYADVQSMALLMARGRRAMFEYTPIRPAAPGRIYRVIPMGPLVDVFALDNRTFRGPNDGNHQPKGAPWLGPDQRRWLLQALAASTATWKVIAVGNPLGLVIRHGAHAFEGVANADGGPASGREVGLKALLEGMKRLGVKNTVWITADVHYAAAHHYDPARGRGADFDPFWEFVAGPLHAGTFGPNALDPTFGPEVRFQKAAGDTPNLPPSAGLQFFGELEVDPTRHTLTVTLRDRGGAALWSQTLAPG